ncbi:hypothetical protein FER63_23450 [Salmonella enterica]|nr:hypothetical protein [Salmonella enterica]
MTPHKIFYDYRIPSIAFYDSMITMLTSSAIDEYMIMKRYHVISIAVLTGLIMGLSFGAKADTGREAVNSTGATATAKTSSYVCGNSGLSVDVVTDFTPRMVSGHIAYKVLFSVRNEKGRVVFGDDEELDINGGWMNASRGGYGVYWSAPGTLKVVKVKNDGGFTDYLTCS